jgi:alpha-glucosidase (family GH31 glycosyl hydrolase)
MRCLQGHHLFVAFLSALLLGAPGNGLAQGTPGSYQGHVVDGATVRVDAERATLRLAFYRPNVLRVDWTPDGRTHRDSSLAVRHGRHVAGPPQVHRADSMLYVRSGRLTAALNTTGPLRLRVLEGGAPLLATPDAGGFVAADTARTVRFRLGADTHVYGTGERGPQFDLRGRAFDVYNTQQPYSSVPATMNVNVPFLATSAGYGLFVDSVHPGRFDLGRADSTQWRYTAENVVREEEASPSADRFENGTLTYYVIAAERVAEQVRHYTWLTGRQPLPPKWAFGYIQSKYGYKSAAEARGIVDTLRQKRIPTDGLVLDLYWFKRMGDLAWDRDAFPEPFRMMRDFRDRGIKTIAITEPYITEFSRLYPEATREGYVATDAAGGPYRLEDWWSCDTTCAAALVDLTDPAARGWWWSQYPDFAGTALAGFWTDLGEPEKHPDGMQHHGGPARAVHNAYNWYWAQAIFEGHRRWRPNQRLFNLTRSGFAGMQRFGPILWSGDVRRTFEAFDGQTALMLNMGLSGFGYFSSDLGGFTGGEKNPELYVRWLQHGAFTPTMRVHSYEDLPNAPWRFGDEAERIVGDYIRLRYRLLPYIYTLARQNHRTGLPLVRPLFFADPDDPALRDVRDAYLFGDAFLTAPVTEDGKRTKAVRLPTGRWYHYWSDRPVEGGRTVVADAPLDQLPLYVRGGHIVPMQPVQQYVGQRPVDTLRLAVYPRATDGEPFTLYEDDGQTLDYRDGAYAETRLQQRWRHGADSTRALQLDIGAATGGFDGLPERRTYRAEIHGMQQVPTSVTHNGQPLPQRSSRAALEREGGYYYAMGDEMLYVQVSGATDRAHRLVAQSVSLVAPR